MECRQETNNMHHYELLTFLCIVKREAKILALQ